MAHLLRLQELGFNEFGKMRDEWNSLVTRDPNGSVFDTWEWLFAFWANYDRKKDLPILLTVRNDGQLMAAGAFRLRRWEHKSRFFWRDRSTLEFLAQGPSDYNTVLISPECAATEISRHLCRHLLLHSPRVDQVVLRQIRSGSPTYEILGGMGIRPNLSDGPVTPYLLLSRSWKDQETSLGRRLRSNIWRYERRLKRDYPDMEIIVKAEPSDDELGQSFDLHNSRMSSLSREQKASTIERSKRLHSQFAHLAFKSKWTRLIELKVRGEIVASLYGFVFKNRFCAYNTGFNPEFAEYSPGTLLFARSVRASIEEGLDEYDFLRGGERYKYHWTRTVRHNQVLRMVSRTPFSMLKGFISLMDRQERR